MIYLASPYTHPNPEVVFLRVTAAAEATAVLLEKGSLTFSPVVHCHFVNLVRSLPDEHWYKITQEYLRRCTHCMVLRLPNWQNSRGVQEEIALAKKLNIGLGFYNPKGFVSKVILEKLISEEISYGQNN